MRLDSAKEVFWLQTRRCERAKLHCTALPCRTAREVAGRFESSNAPDVESARKSERLVLGASAGPVVSDGHVPINKLEGELGTGVSHCRAVVGL